MMPIKSKERKKNGDRKEEENQQKIVYAWDWNLLFVNYICIKIFMIFNFLFVFSRSACCYHKDVYVVLRLFNNIKGNGNCGNKFNKKMVIEAIKRWDIKNYIAFKFILLDNDEDEAGLVLDSLN